MQQVHNTIFARNKSDVIAFEIAAIKNNKLVACYLAEVMYNLKDNTNTALMALNSPDSQGNTIIHMLARKGDESAEALKGLLDMKLADGSRFSFLIFLIKKYVILLLVPIRFSRYMRKIYFLFKK